MRKEQLVPKHDIQVVNMEAVSKAGAIRQPQETLFHLSAGV